MAINTQKLLPPSKISSPLANFSGMSSGLSIQKKSTDVNRITQLSVKYNEQNVDIVRKSLVDVDTLLKSVLTEDRNTTELKRRRKEREEFEERESNLELPREQKKFRLPAVSLPGMSFLDRVKRFLLFTGIGWLFTNFQDQLPKLLGIIKIITPIYGVVENVFKFILSSVVNFIERGYEAYDRIRGLVKSIGGEGAQQSFDALSSKLNEYINYILVGGLALTGAISAFASNVSKFKSQPQPQRPATGSRPTVTRGAGGAPVRTGAARVTTSGGKLAERSIAKNILRKTVKPALSRLPVVGALIEFGLSWALGDPVGKAAFRGIGSLIVGAVGTAIGGPIGAAIGGLLGGEIGGRLYDTFFGGKKPAAYRNGGRVLRTYAKGGGVLGDYGLGRTLQVERSRKPAPPSQSTQPGRDVGGQKEIKRLFPNVNENPLTINIKPNPYYALQNTASDFKSAPYGLGSLMGGAIDVALGQKMSNTTILNASVGLENMFYDNYDRDRNYIDVQSIIFGVIKSAADSALNNIQNELSKGKKKEEKEKEKPSAPPAGGGGGGGGTGGGGGGGAAPGPSGGSIIATGFSDSQGRSIRLKGLAADAFIDMANEAKSQGIDLGPAISSSYRSLEDQIRVYKEKYGANWRQNMVWKSRHMEGNAFDINWYSKGGVWIRNNASRFGFVFNSYSGDSSHFDWSGNYTPKSKIAAQEYAKTPTTVTKPSTKTGTPPGPVPKGGTLSTSQLISVARQAGFDEKTATIMGAVAFAESSGRSGVSRSDTDVHGLWQIQFPSHKEKLKKIGITSREQLYDPLTNAKAAKAVYDSQGITAWEAYTNGRYKNYLPKAQKGGDVSRISSSNNYIPKQPSKYNTKSIEMYPYYAEGGTGTRTVFQRIFVKEMIPMPMSENKTLAFPVSGGVNNNTNLSNLSQG